MSGLVEAVAAGAAGLLVLEGPSGIGKASLAGVPRERAASVGLRVLGSREPLAQSLAAEGVAPTAEHVGRIGGVHPQLVSRAVLTRISPPARELARALPILDEPTELALAAALAKSAWTDDGRSRSARRVPITRVRGRPRIT